MWYNKSMNNKIRKLLIVALLASTTACTIPDNVESFSKQLENFNVSEPVKDVKKVFQSISDTFDEFVHFEQEGEKIDGWYQVDYVIDGDTFLIRRNGERVKVILIGVDTPESVASDEYLEKKHKQNVPEGKKAFEFTTKALSGASVYIECDKEQKDLYGRILAYVYLDEAKTVMLQDELLKNGMARCMEIEPNTKCAEHFRELENEAKRNNVGFWATELWKEN